MPRIGVIAALSYGNELSASRTGCFTHKESLLLPPPPPIGWVDTIGGLDALERRKIYICCRELIHDSSVAE